MGDRVTVMRDGTLQQVDTPQHLYDNPDNIFVAAFIGSPAQNLYDAVIGEGARSVKLGSQSVMLPDAIAKDDFVLFEAMGAYTVSSRSPFNGYYPDSWAIIDA